VGAFAPRAPPMIAATRRRLADILFGRGVTLGLAVTAILLGLATFVLLAGGSPFGPTRPGQIVAVVLANAFVLALLGASLAARIVRVWAERRRGSAGARLHVRLVMLFGVVAVVPALIVAAFAAVFFNLGIQAWFSDRVRNTLEASLVASRAWLDQHRDEIRVDALAMAADLNRAAGLFLPENPGAFERLLITQSSIRGLTEAVVFEAATSRVLAQAGFLAGGVVEPPPAWALDQVRTGEVAVIPSETDARVRALATLDTPAGFMLLIGRPLDGSVLEHMRTTEIAFQQYDQLDRNRGSLQVTFALIFACAALLVLLAAVLVGLVFANGLARPISRLITAAERVRGGDLSTRVEEGTQDDELATLSRAFNRMTSQLSAQRGELMEAYRQIDERRRFTETVLAGVSAGVIGLDAAGRINLPNRRASELLELDLDAGIGLPLSRVVPEFTALVAEAAAAPDRPRTAEIPAGPPSRRRTLFARIGAETRGGQVTGYVLTFDDITELQSAQRKAAWADVARRIAHEIKNPLTPIQLSAERLKRKYLKEIGSDPDTFRTLTDTIVRQVGDIGRMVDEFSAFARMPQPVIRPENLGQVMREALVLQTAAHPEIAYQTTIHDPAPVVPLDRRLIGQALTNLLQNAADAVNAVPRAEGEHGHIALRLERVPEGWAVIVEDDGIGLPEGEERARLAEPYVTHKAKGTGLGLAIVKKIMEDHGGALALDDRPEGRGARAVLILPPMGATTDARAEEAGLGLGRVGHGA
jgi:two-component system nitrogen regulation sensor histidine kinase NtrY